MQEIGARVFCRRTVRLPPSYRWRKQRWHPLAALAYVTLRPHCRSFPGALAAAPVLLQAFHSPLALSVPSLHCAVTAVNTRTYLAQRGSTAHVNGRLERAPPAFSSPLVPSARSAHHRAPGAPPLAIGAFVLHSVRPCRGRAPAQGGCCPATTPPASSSSSSRIRSTPRYVTPAACRPSPSAPAGPN